MSPKLWNPLMRLRSTSILFRASINSQNSKSVVLGPIKPTSNCPNSSASGTIAQITTTNKLSAQKINFTNPQSSMLILCNILPIQNRSHLHPLTTRSQLLRNAIPLEIQTHCTFTRNRSIGKKSAVGWKGEVESEHQVCEDKRCGCGSSQ